MMVLFFLILITIIVLTLGIKIELVYFNVENLEKLNLILDMLLIGDKKSILKYIRFKVKIQICIFNIIPIFTKTITNHNTKVPEQRKNSGFVDKLKERVISSIEITKFYYKIIIGSKDIVLVSSLVSILGIITSSVLPYIIEEKRIQNVYYKIKPKYNRNAFYMNLAMNINLPIYKII